jgi:20S proteasome subunit beta 6
MYENNGGTVIALAGDNFAVITADSRLSQGYSILSRDISRMWKISTTEVWLGISGCHSDALGVVDALEAIAADFRWDQGSEPDIEV